MTASLPKIPPESRKGTSSKDGIRATDVDSLWGMPVLVTVVAFLSTVVITNAPFFFVRFMDAYGATHEIASWPLTIVALVSHLVGLPIYLIQHQVSVYRITLLGSLLTWLGIVSSAFATSITWLTISIGVFYGAGMGILMICLSIYTMDYFDKYRGTVSGLKYVGWSASGLVFPAVLAKLVDIYHMRGALLILGGLTMNVMPLILLFEYPAATMKCEGLQTMTHFVKKGLKGASFKNEDEDARIRALGTHSHAVGLGTTAVGHKSSSTQIMPLRLEYSLDSTAEHRDSCTKAAGDRSSDAWRSRDTREVDAAIPCCSKSISAIVGESLARHGQQYKATKREYGVDARIQSCSSNVTETALSQSTLFPSSTSSCVPASTHLNIRTPLIVQKETASTKSGTNLLQEVWILLRTPALYAISVTYVFFDYSHIVIMNNVVAYAVDKGSPLPLADSLIMYASVSGVVGRLSLPLASDMIGLSRDVFVACNLVVMALCLALLAEVAAPALVTVLVVGVSLAAGSVLSMKPVLVAEYVGVRMMTATWGVMGLLMVPLLLTGPLIVGFFRDGRGSFDNLYRLHSALNLIIALILFVLAFHRKVHANKSADAEK